MKHFICSSLFVLAVAGAATGHESGKPMAGVQSLDISRSDQRLHMLLGEAATADAPAALSYTRSEDAGVTWAKPVRVDLDNKPAAGLHRGMDAQLAAYGSYIVAVWQTAGTDSWGGGPMATAFSSDLGLTWQRGPNPADDGSTEGHNFIDIAVDGKGTFHLVWLDTRNGKRGLRTATSSDHGHTWSPNRTVDEETCECCWNTVAASPEGGAWVIYRDKSPRDMTVAALHDGSRAPVPAGRFQWEFPGCPHVGAGLSVSPVDKALHTTVWSGKEQKTGVYYLRSQDAAATWSEPVQLGDETATNPDCAAGEKNVVVAVWNAPTKHALTVKAAFSKDGGVHWSGAKTVSSRDASATHPRVTSTHLGFRIFWTEVDGTQLNWKSVPFEPIE